MNFSKKIDPNITWKHVKDASAENQDELFEKASDTVIYTLASMEGDILLSSKAKAQIGCRNNMITLKNTIAGAAGGLISSIIFYHAIQNRSAFH